MQAPKRCRVSSRETENIFSQSPISKDSCSDNSSHDQEIDYDELSEEELLDLQVQSWKLFSHIHYSNSLPKLDARTQVHLQQILQPVAGGLGTNCGIGLKCLTESVKGKCMVISELAGIAISKKDEKKFVSEGHFFVGPWGYVWGSSTMRANCINIGQDLLAFLHLHNFMVINFFIQYCVLNTGNCQKNNANIKFSE